MAVKVGVVDAVGVDDLVGEELAVGVDVPLGVAVDTGVNVAGAGSGGEGPQEDHCSPFAGAVILTSLEPSILAT